MANNKIVRLGRSLYRLRAVIAAPFFIMLLVFSRPSSSLHIIASLLILTGLLVRIWAAGYIGKQSRENEFCAVFIITNGPYRYVKHPLYLGNFFLVGGVILLFNAPLWLSILLVVLFIAEYSIIIYSEMRFLKGLARKEADFKLINIKGEISTIFILFVIYVLYVGRVIVMSN
jgi:protein-S-isoprenylcysteine O-methyltransferase Ste14